jgi:predicted metallo-beta-lactamase superfamily hydrolase
MKVTPLAADSMGVRSSAFLVESGTHRLVLDPGARLAPKRYDLPPSNQEKVVLERLNNLIETEVDSADILVISHYHNDHFKAHADYYKNKQIFVKSWESDINHKQRERALKLQDHFKELKVESEVSICDGTTSVIDSDLKLIFSNAVPHGSIGAKTGYVVMITVAEPDFTFMYSSDIQGPVEPSTADQIIAMNPNLLYLDGPPTNLLGNIMTIADLEKAINNILDILTYTNSKVILDHHLLRDVNYREHLQRVFDFDGRVQTAAEYLGNPNTMLEANRDKLWKTEGELSG